MKLESAVQERLGSVPFWRGTVKCSSELERMYQKAMEAARKALNDEARSHGQNRNMV